MAIVKYGTPVDYMNIKQLRRIARDSNLYFTNVMTKAQLVALINA